MAGDDNADGARVSARREYERRHANARARAQARYGRVLGSAVAAFTEPASTRAWSQGADGENATAREFARRGLDLAHGVVVLHDRRTPGRGRANIDHLIVCPPGIIVVDTKSGRGRVEIVTKGIFQRRELLLVGGRDGTGQLDKLERQIEHVRALLSRQVTEQVAVSGALAYPNMTRPWLYSGLVRGGLILVDQPAAIAKLARKRGPHGPDEVRELAAVLDRSFRPA
ncbi:MAG: nuclease-related domain-containing protein [Steroidobacteraceae bacterium]